jgi:hypothetical protein
MPSIAITTGIMVSPIVNWIVVSGGAPPPVDPNALLLESGGTDYILLESGATDYILLES